jgi:myo-inositol 2-dehydrogenase/D-chiro-inositol 1-dehydrogenase
MQESKLNPGQPSVNRRSFLKTSSLAMGGAAALSALPIERVVHAQPSNKLKLALVGCGGRGSGATIQAMNTGKDVQLVAMADAFEDNLARRLSAIRAKKPDQVDVPPGRQFVGKDAYKKAMAEADVVILATPPGFRPLHFEEAVKQGKHIFFEKPVAVDGPGIRKVLEAAKEAKKKNLKIGVGLQRHHQPSYMQAIERIHDGAIGDVVSMRSYWNGNPVGHKGTRQRLRDTLGHEPTEMEYQMRNWYQFVWLCGDHIVEQHIHNLDVINWIKGGYPVRAQGMGGREVRKGIDDGEIFDHHFVEFEYADGSRNYSQCRHIRGCFNSVSEHVVGTKGKFEQGRGGFTLTGPNAWNYRAKGEDGHQLEHFPLWDAIRNNKPYNEAEYGAMSTMTAILGRMCTYTGKKIEMADALTSPVSTMPDDLKFNDDSQEWSGTPQSQPDKNGQYPIAVPGDPEWYKKIVTG